VPSSLLFAGLVATWLAVLVPMAARRRQPMPRPSDAALAGRVLARPRRREQEVSPMDSHTVWPDPGEAPRYRRGRGGYDPEAAALAAQARYVSRQRIVVALVLLALTTGLIAGGLAMPGVWYLHAAVDVCLLGYLVYLRIQVREEQAIRYRRSARMAGTRFADGYGPGNDEDEDGYEATDFAEQYPEQAWDDDAPDGEAEQPDAGSESSEESKEPAAPIEPVAEEPALPRLRPAAPLERPRGTVVLELDDEDPELHELDSRSSRGHRRAAGQ
jgi:hypothetical protein